MSFDVASRPRRVPDPGAAGERPAAGLSRQRRLGAEAARGDRGDERGRWSAPTPTCTAACTRSPTRPPKPTRRRAKACARLINAASAAEIVFTKGGTEAINLVASSFGQSLQAGDEIVLSEMEHHANIVPWHFLRERKGVVLKFVPVTDDGRLDLAAYRDLLGPRTRMVARQPHVERAGHGQSGRRDHRRRPMPPARLTLIDGCQAVVHGQVDVQALDADFYAFSGHKLYGPTGIGALYGKAERLAALPPYQGGGEMIGHGHAGRHHLRRPAAPVRGRHAADPRGDRPGRGHRVAGRRWTATPSPPTSTRSTSG